MAAISSPPGRPVPGTGESVIASSRETPGVRIIFGPGRLAAIEDEVRRLSADRVLAGKAGSPVHGIEVQDIRD
jgi:hypothetical protein